MKLKFLGTAASEGIPAIFCDCKSCRKSQVLGGKNIRTRSQALIDDKLLIDFPCDTYYHFLVHNINWSQIRHCLVTHIHEDHFYPDEFNNAKKGLSIPHEDWSLCVYGSEDLQSKMTEIIPASDGFIKFHNIRPFEPFQIDKYTITALKAYHGTAHPYIYLISDGNSTILYAHDTDMFPEETWNYLCEKRVHLNLVSLDCTSGANMKLEWHGHMCLGLNIECREKLSEYGLIDESTTVILNHFSHNGSKCLYDEFVPIAKNHGFEVSFDGMEISV